MKQTILIIGLCLLLTGCMSSYTAHTKDCLSQKRYAYCNGIYGFQDDPYCGAFPQYKQEWKEECRMEYSGIQPPSKEHVMVKVDFEVTDYEMRCLDREFRLMNKTEQYFYFDLWKTGEYDTQFREYKHYTEEIKYPEFQIDFSFPRDEFEDCEVKRFEIKKTITKENMTFSEECDDYEFHDYLSRIDEYNYFDKRGFEGAIIDCLTRT